MYYPDSVLQEVREQNDIVSIISDYVPLQKRGSNYFGLCPFHGEKTPSFSVNEKEQFYKCFGCGAGGNVITFLMKMENLSFQEAVQTLADRAHITLPEAKVSEEEKRRVRHRERLLEIVSLTARFYYYYLTKAPEGEGARSYLKTRGVTEEYLRKFGLGFSPVKSGALYAYLLNKGFSPDEMLEAGVIIGSKEKPYDRFFNRLMFPILDVQGRPIAFGGRVMGQGEPKYLNSSDNQLFNKRRNLYGLSFAKKSRRKDLIVVEGYMDVLSLHQAGFDNAIASLGTSLTEGQAILMKRYTDKVILCYDSDSAGIAAIRRAIPILEASGLEIQVAKVTGAKDPDELIKSHGKEAFEKVLENALEPVEFELNTLLRENGEAVEGRIQTLHAMARRLADIPNDMERELHIKDIADKMRVSPSSLTEEVEEIRRTSGLLEVGRYAGERRKEERGRMKDRQDASMQLLSCLIRYPRLYESIHEYLDLRDFEGEDAQSLRVADFVLQHLKSGKAPVAADIVSLFDQVEEQEACSHMISLFDQAPGAPSRLALSLPSDTEEMQKWLNQTIQSLKRRTLEKQLSSEAFSGEEAVRMKQMLSNIQIKLADHWAQPL